MTDFTELATDVRSAGNVCGAVETLIEGIAQMLLDLGSQDSSVNDFANDLAANADNLAPATLKGSSLLQNEVAAWRDRSGIAT